MQEKFPFIKYNSLHFEEQDMFSRSKEFYKFMDGRRSVRDFSSKKFPLEILENILRTANTAPSGANKQPWTFCIVSDPEIKKQIRIAAEKEEFENYNGRMSEEWIRDLLPLGTDWKKEFLEIAPYLIVVFKRSYEWINQQKRKNYYVQESVGLACGLLIAAIHHAGLVCLTHTPSPMNFLHEVLQRPENEKAFLLIPVGYPANPVFVPDIQRKKLSEFGVFYTKDES